MKPKYLLILLLLIIISTLNSCENFYELLSNPTNINETTIFEKSCQGYWVLRDEKVDNIIKETKLFLKDNILLFGNKSVLTIDDNKIKTDNFNNKPGSWTLSKKLNDNFLNIKHDNLNISNAKITISSDLQTMTLEYISNKDKNKVIATYKRLVPFLGKYILTSITDRYDKPELTCNIGDELNFTLFTIQKTDMSSKCTPSSDFLILHDGFNLGELPVDGETDFIYYSTRSAKIQTNSQTTLIGVKVLALKTKGDLYSIATKIQVIRITNTIIYKEEYIKSD